MAQNLVKYNAVELLCLVPRAGRVEARDSYGLVYNGQYS